MRRRSRSSWAAAVRNVDLAELANYIDWGPFFQAWDLAGPFPAILHDEIVGEPRAMLRDGQAMLQRIIETAG